MSEVSASVGGSLSQTDWDQVHEQVQVLFEPLANQVGRQLPTVRSELGRTSGRVWFLYSYRDFVWPDEQEGKTEAVVVGVTLAPGPSGNGIWASGDISGGESGHTYYEIEERELPATCEAVLAAAREIAGELSQQVDVVVNALRERRPPPDYRSGALHSK